MALSPKPGDSKENGARPTVATAAAAIAGAATSNGAADDLLTWADYNDIGKDDKQAYVHVLMC